MVLISETEFRRASGVGLKKSQARILGEIALRGSVSKGEILNLSQEPRLVEDLLRRKIIKREPNGAFKLGEFGPGHCRWIWGKNGKPKAGKIPKEKPARTARKRPVKPKRAPKPSTPPAPRDAEHEARKRRAIERNRRRFRP